MLMLDRNSKVDFAKYKRHLGYLGFIYYDIEYLHKRVNFMQERLDTMRYLLNVYVRECSDNTIINADSAGIRKLLINYKGVPENLLYVRDGRSYKPSINKQVLSRVRDLGKAVDLIDLFLEYTSLRTKTGLVRKAFFKCKDSDVVANDGSPLCEVSHKFEENGTLRTYYSDFNHQQLDYEDLKALKAPKGYSIVVGDFAQSDFKIAYNMLLRDPSNIDTMFRYKDSYEAIARILEGTNFNKEQFVEDRKIYKKCSLAPLYGGKGAFTEKENKITHMMGDYFNSLKPYASFKDNIVKRMKLGLPIVVKTFFGTEVMVNTYGKLDNNILNSYLSAPCQTGTSEVVILCANAIMDRFAEFGITEENGGIYLAYNKHDELVFYLKNEYMNYSWIFQENKDIIVDGWMPLEIEFDFTDRYGVPNDQIDKMFKGYYKDQPPLDVDKLIDNAEKAEFFIPCEGVLEVVVAHHVDVANDRTVIAMLDVATEEVKYTEISTSDLNKVVESIVLLINRNAEYLKSKNVTAAIVYSTLLTYDKSYGSEITVGFKTSFDADLFLKANRLLQDKLRTMSEDSNELSVHQYEGKFRDVKVLVNEAISYIKSLPNDFESLSKYNPSSHVDSKYLVAIAKGEMTHEQVKTLMENDDDDESGLSKDEFDLFEDDSSRLEKSFEDLVIDSFLFD